MIDTKILLSVFEKHGINSVLLIPSENRNIFLIKEMPSSICLNRWEHLENILKDICKKDCDILSHEYASNYINIEKGVVIEK